MEEKAFEAAFVGYSTTSKAFRVYKRQSRAIIESVNVTFDEVEDISPNLSNEYIASSTSVEVDSSHQRNISQLFESIYSEYLEPDPSSTTPLTTPITEIHQEPETPLAVNQETTSLPPNQENQSNPPPTFTFPTQNQNEVETQVDPTVTTEDVPSTSASTVPDPINPEPLTPPTIQRMTTRLQSGIIKPKVMMNLQTYVDLDNDLQSSHQILPHSHKWTIESPLFPPSESCNLSLCASANFCQYSSFLSNIEPSKADQAILDPDWYTAMQEEMNQFSRLNGP